MSSPRRTWWWSAWLEEVATALRRETVGFNRRDLHDKTVRAIIYRRTLLREREAALGKAATRLLAADLEILNGIMKCNAELLRRGHAAQERETVHPLDAALKIVASGEDVE